LKTPEGAVCAGAQRSSVIAHRYDAWEVAVDRRQRGRMGMAADELAGAHIPPGAGEAYWVGGEHITFKVRGAQTGGTVALIEDEVQPGYGPPPHLHLHENEAFYVVAGEFTFTLGDRTVEAPPGSLLTVPQG
jgi:mannose-6-phosphate isomerase-like protein (cupin superfamily)